MAGRTLNNFALNLLEELRALEDRRRTNTPGPSRDEVIGNVEADLREEGFEPWQLYKSFLDTVTTPGIRHTAVNLLHDPARVPEYAAKEIADTLIGVMQVQDLDYNLGQQTIMAASILRAYPATPMLPIPKDSIDSYFIPFVEQVPAPRLVRGRLGQEYKQSQAEANLDHTAHMLASIARFTVVHNNAYDDLLAHKINEFYEAQAAVRSQLEQEGKLDERGFYAIVHPMEHLAELMDQATMTRDKSLVGLLVKKGVVDRFNALEEQRAALGIQGGDVERYKRQRTVFVSVAAGIERTVD